MQTPGSLSSGPCGKGRNDAGLSDHHFSPALDDGFDGTAALADHFFQLAQRRFDRRRNGRTAQGCIGPGRLAVEDIEGPIGPDGHGNIQVGYHGKDRHGTGIDAVDAGRDGPFQFVLDDQAVLFADNTRRTGPQSRALFMSGLDGGLPAGCARW